MEKSLHDKIDAMFDQGLTKQEILNRLRLADARPVDEYLTAKFRKQRREANHSAFSRELFDLFPEPQDKKSCAWHIGYVEVGAFIDILLSKYDIKEKDGKAITRSDTDLQRSEEDLS